LNKYKDEIILFGEIMKNPEKFYQDEELNELEFDKKDNFNNNYIEDENDPNRTILKNRERLRTKFGDRFITYNDFMISNIYKLNEYIEGDIYKNAIKHKDNIHNLNDEKIIFRLKKTTDFDINRNNENNELLIEDRSNINNKNFVENLDSSHNNNINKINEISKTTSNNNVPEYDISIQEIQINNNPNNNNLKINLDTIKMNDPQFKDELLMETSKTN